MLHSVAEECTVKCTDAAVPYVGHFPEWQSRIAGTQLLEFVVPQLLWLLTKETAVRCYAPITQLRVDAILEFGCEVFRVDVYPV
jgi:hypothetical protein